MAITTIVTEKRSKNFDNILEFILDAQSDLANIPTYAPSGSTATLADGSITWIKAPSGTWTQTA